MTPIKAAIDAQTSTRKPTGAEIARISTRIANSGAEHYELPVLFAYKTFSSTQHDKFRGYS